MNQSYNQNNDEIKKYSNNLFHSTKLQRSVFQSQFEILYCRLEFLFSEIWLYGTVRYCTNISYQYKDTVQVPYYTVTTNVLFTIL